MKELIYYRFRVVFGVKNILIINSIFFFLGLINVYLMKQKEVYESVNKYDYFLVAIGGPWVHMNFFTHLYWLIIIVMLILLNHTSINKVDHIDVMLLSRSKYRIKWWVSKVITSMLVTLIYTIFFVMINLVLANIFWDDTNHWSYYTEENLKYIFSSGLEVDELVATSFICIYTGFITLIMLLQLVILIFNNTYNLYLFSILVITVMSFLYKTGVIPKFMSPFYFSSLLDIYYTYGNYLLGVFSNIIITLLIIIISCLFARKADYS